MVIFEGLRLELESDRGGIADFGRAEVLDGAGECVGGFLGPSGSVFFKFAESGAVEFDEGFFNNGNHFAVAAFHVHHLGHGDSARLPLRGGLGEAANGADVAGEFFPDEKRGGKAERVAVVGIEIRRKRTASLVAEVVGQGSETAFISAGRLEVVQAGFHKVDEEALGIDAGDLDIAVRVAVEDELVGDVVGEGFVEAGGGSGEFFGDEGALGGEVGQGVEGIAVVGECFVEFADEDSHFGNEFDQTFGNEDGSEFFAVGGALGDGVGDVIDDVFEGELALGDFLGNERDVWASLESALETDVRSRAAHELDEVPVFSRRDGIALNVSDEVGVDFAGGVEAKAGLDVFAFEVAIDGLGNADNRERGLAGGGEFSEFGGVRIRVITADDDQRGEVAGFGCFEGLQEILFGFQLGAAGADDVEAAGVSVAFQKLGIDLRAVIGEKAIWAIAESNEGAFGVDLFNGIEDSRDHIVSTRRWATREDHADNDGSWLWRIRA